MFSMMLIAGTLWGAESERVQVHLTPSLEQDLVIGKVAENRSKAAARIIETQPSPPLVATIEEGRIVVRHGPVPGDRAAVTEDEQ